MAESISHHINSDEETFPSQTGCLGMLSMFSIFVASFASRDIEWQFGTAFTALALFSMCFRVGWVVPLMITGTYFGLIVLDPTVKGGDGGAQARETATMIIIGTLSGFAVGLLIDSSSNFCADEDIVCGSSVDEVDLKNDD